MRWCAMPRDPKPSATDPALPTFEARPICPNCGQSPAIVFPLLAGGPDARNPKLVCLLCCPKRTTDS
jgi:hypothetical protein